MNDSDRIPPASPIVYEARFIDTAASTADELRVVIPSYDDGEHAHGPVVWAPRVDNAGAAAFPADGDWGAVTETDLGSWLVLLWTTS